MPQVRIVRHRTLAALCVLGASAIGTLANEHYCDVLTLGDAFYVITSNRSPRSSGPNEGGCLLRITPCWFVVTSLSRLINLTIKDDLNAPCHCKSLARKV